ncbi:zf-HC2 domain-containing protein [Pyxidicoccus sp. 3LFB2]
MACLDESTFVELLVGGLPPARAAEVDAHLDTCASCRRLVADGMRAQPPTRARPAKSPRSPRPAPPALKKRCWRRAPPWAATSCWSGWGAGWHGRRLQRV